MADKKKINRDGVIYVEPTEKSYGDPKDYAQCSTCLLWAGEKRKRCFILGKDLEVLGNYTCCLYTNGEPQVELLSNKEIKAYTPEEAGFYKGRVQCGRCQYFNPTLSQCKLFFILQMEMPEDFDFGNFRVNSNGCCNMWVKSEK